MSDEIPRRVKIYQFEPAETAIHKAQNEVEAMPPDVRLTRAGQLLALARWLVADFVDGLNPGGRCEITFADGSRGLVGSVAAVEDSDISLHGTAKISSTWFEESKGTYDCPICGIAEPHSLQSLEAKAKEWKRKADDADTSTDGFQCTQHAEYIEKCARKHRAFEAIWISRSPAVTAGIQPKT